MKHWVEGHWYFSGDVLAMCYIPSGEYEDNERKKPAIQLETHLLPGLFQSALDSGVLPMTPSRDVKTEDLKIIHCPWWT